MIILSGNFNQNLDLTAAIKSPDLYQSPQKFSALNPAQQTALISNGLNDTYVAQECHRPRKAERCDDVADVKGRKLVRNAMNFVKSTLKCRLAIIHNQVSEMVNSPLIRAVEAAVPSQPEYVARKLVTKLLRSNSKKGVMLSDNAVKRRLLSCTVRRVDLTNKLLQ